MLSFKLAQKDMQQHSIEDYPSFARSDLSHLGECKHLLSAKTQTEHVVHIVDWFDHNLRRRAHAYSRKLFRLPRVQTFENQAFSRFPDGGEDAMDNMEMMHLAFLRASSPPHASFNALFQHAE